DASLIARGTFNASFQIYKQLSGSYTLWYTYQNPAPLAECTHLAVTGDNLSLVAGYRHAETGYADVQVLAFDVSAQTPQVTMNQFVHGSGYQNNVTALSVSQDGQRFAVGMAGDQAGLAPEVIVFQKNPSDSTWGPFFFQDLSGSVQDLSLS